VTVEFSPAAEADLEQIALYIARDDVRSVLAFIADIERRCRDLATVPRAAPLREYLGRGIRVMPFRNYLVCYRVDVQDDVRIERILHGGRDLTKILDGADDE
jgi:toxin ParE1/3/4